MTVILKQTIKWVHWHQSWGIAGDPVECWFCHFLPLQAILQAAQDLFRSLWWVENHSASDREGSSSVHHKGDLFTGEEQLSEQSF